MIFTSLFFLTHKVWRYRVNHYDLRFLVFSQSSKIGHLCKRYWKSGQSSLRKVTCFQNNSLSVQTCRAKYKIFQDFWHIMGRSWSWLILIYHISNFFRNLNILQQVYFAHRCEKLKLKCLMLKKIKYHFFWFIQGFLKGEVFCFRYLEFLI